ncbi:hypothetical protein BC749_10292 [Flavobacterium araucananum]|uniref:hypothetical protein n=1 Tax=Flavobacterium araucananum TaxID=946678 RepID=UPI000D797886|nr:hypothetical protein [Flavobacterium araucananum]PWK00529.1 hypothetical protein BC749_10292 [Flavobacterium araucananum]
MYKILNVIGNIDNFLATLDGEPFEEMTVRLFNPVWSQAMSDDKGKTREWNWYMYMSKTT